MMVAVSQKSITMGPAESLARAAEVLRLEAQALERLAQEVGDSFLNAVEIIEQVKGKLVITGMGKSGHIANKAAATFASTGTPAFFVHPGEASHGDLGMLTADDVVLALSNSGNTRELSDIIAYCRRFSIPLIAIVGNERNVLAEASDVALVLPKVPEACPNGLAPTTSTTASLALCDALALVLLDRRGFTKEDFALFHPGGALGKKLLRVHDIMFDRSHLPLCQPETVMSEALLIMTETGFGCTGVVEDGLLVGIVTDGDLRRHMSSDLLSRKVGEIMTHNPHTIRPDALAVEALATMNSPDTGKPFTSIFAVEDGKPVGFLRMHDILRAGVA